MINDAREQLAIVSPYVDRVTHVEQAILRAKNNGAQVVVFVRRDGKTLGGRNSKDALEWFRSTDIEVVGVPNLHAKFYMNEREAVVTSMNLLKSSWTSSLELGIVVGGDAHRQLVDYLKGTVRVISRAAPAQTASKTGASTRAPRSRASRPSTVKRSKPNAKPSESSKGFLGTVFGAVRDILALDEGYCIRCGEPLTESEVDAGKTMCRKDYLSWARHKRPSFPEKFCTTCGAPHTTSFAKPQCDDCFADSTG